MAVIALDNAEREINAGGESARGGEIAVFYESSSPLEPDIWKLFGKVTERAVKCGGSVVGIVRISPGKSASRQEIKH